jgi:hypothetical protein
MYALTPTVTRRQFLVLAGAVAGAQFCPALEAESSRVEPQPYFAGVKRTLESLAKLGAPVAVPDAKQIASLARQNDAEAVVSAEKIPTAIPSRGSRSTLMAHCT